MIQPTDIHTLTQFKKDPTLMHAILRGGRPHVLTIDGRPKLVVQDAAAYEQVLDAIETAQVRGAVLESLDDIAAGRTKPARQVFTEIRKRTAAKRKRA